MGGKRIGVRCWYGCWLRRGTFLLRPIVVICTPCSEQSQENLSEQTRKAWGDFVDQNLPGVPHSLEPDSIPVMF